MLGTATRRVLGTVLAAGIGVAGAGCAATPSTRPAGGGLAVAASINAWGSILAQLGGGHVRATSILANPDTDPHSYEPTPADSRTIAVARLVVVNGAGYDPWVYRLLAANPDPHRVVVDVGRLVGVAPGGNPHRWYSPADVEQVADAVTAGLRSLDPANAGAYDALRASFEDQGLADYHALVTQIRSSYAGTPIGASESIVAPLADALGLRLLTPPAFLKAISEGADPSAADKATIDAQLAHRVVKVYVYNAQNTTPDVAAQVKAARALGIPVVSVTETLTPAGTTFEAWQAAQLRDLAQALGRAEAA